MRTAFSVGSKIVLLIVLFAVVGAVYVAFSPKRPVAGAGVAAPQRPSPVIPVITGVRGIVVLGPTCPVATSSPSPACVGRPYSTLVVAFKASDPVHAVAFSRSAADGSFSIRLKPGDYVLGAGEAKLPRCDHPSITVPQNGAATTTISCDTGIR